MDDPITPSSGTHAMLRSEGALARLARWVEGLLDGDRLLAEDGDALLEAIDAARRSLDGGDVEAVHQHTRRVILAIEALVQSGTLDEAHGSTALETARRMLNDVAG